LPLKAGSKLFITGPAADDTGALSGGLTLSWTGGLDSPDKRFVTGGKTILDGFYALAGEYGFTVITDPEEAHNADVTVLVVGEKPYAEWEGDTADLSITGSHALDGNEAAINAAEELGKPVITLIVAGRNVIYDEYEDDWDAVVMCYLPGSEGDGVANVLAGKVPFSGKLPMPYYSSVDDIRTGRVKFELGYGLTAD
jgi:beta-glucosidase